MTITISQKCNGCGQTRPIDPDEMVDDNLSILFMAGRWNWATVAKNTHLCVSCIQEILKVK